MKGATLIISTYNRPDALGLCLQSVAEQKRLPNEIVIADDGSGIETDETISYFRKILSIPLIHVWHEDDGFRLAAIRNKAIASANYDYIIQVDGDMVLHKYFVKDHVDFARQGTFVRASRIYLDKKLSKKMLATGTHNINVFTKGVSNRTSGLRLPVAWRLFESTYKNSGDERYEIHGCNMAYWKKDAIAINGFNESFHGWGPEDKEFVARLLNFGVRKRFIKLGAIAFHLYHQEHSKARLTINEDLLQSSITRKTISCKNGINQYLQNEQQDICSPAYQHLRSS